MEEYDVFVSYDLNQYKQEVIELDNKLKESYKTCRDNEEIIYSCLVDIINEGIEKSKMFLCCLTKEYLKSENKMMELDLAFGLQKPVLWVVFENVKTIDYKDTIRKYSKGYIYLEDSLFVESLDKDIINQAVGKVLSDPVSTF